MPSLSIDINPLSNFNIINICIIDDEQYVENCAKIGKYFEKKFIKLAHNTLLFDSPYGLLFLPICT